MEEKQSWITEVYQEFWDKANELANKDVGDKVNSALTNDYKSKHLDAMVAMFMATMIAPEDGDEEEDEDCGGVEDGDCKDCNHLPDCRQRWAREARKN